MKRIFSIQTRFLPTLAVALLSCCMPVLGQNQITENPQGAEKLRRIWFKKGVGLIGQEVGRAAGTIGNINNDAFDDIAIQNTLDWYLYLGGDPMADSAAWIYETEAFRADLRQPIVGNFLGDSTSLVGFSNARCDTFSGACFVRIFFFTPDTDSILISTKYVLRLEEQPCYLSIHAADLDRDGDDELIVINSEEVCNHTIVRIYEGGEDFDLSEPDYLFRDEEANDQRTVTGAVADFDGDGHLDILLSTNYRSIPKLKVWWGSQTTPANWTDEPDRIIELPVGNIVPDPAAARVLQDVDGDGAVDILSTVGSRNATYLWRSGGLHDTRTRPFDSTDFDASFADVSRTRGFGMMADSTGRYEMIALTPNHRPDIAYGLSGGKNGPNHTYDVFFGGGDGPGFGGVSAGDVNGDGYEDRLVASSSYGGPGVGIAAIITGGSYIPVDDTTLSVRSVATNEHKAALHIWPNPVIDELHIAWRGDLQQRPSRLAVFDMKGREVVHGDVNYWRGEAVWNCTSIASGSYLLVVYENQGAILAAEEVVVQ